MGHRLSKIYTRTGDDGTTGLGDGSRVPKTHARIGAYGTVDEANSAIGVVLAVPNLPPAVTEALTKIQHELFDLGGELAVPGYRAIVDTHIDELEQCLDRFNEPLPPLKEFILPGGGPAAAACHVARAITRRAERDTWALAQTPVENNPKAIVKLTQLAKHLQRLLSISSDSVDSNVHIQLAM
jgi:cob(I)alamin adenosyltransferase